MKTNKPSAARDLTRITLGVVFIGLMIVASLWVLLPFVGATVWATMVVVATWPIMIAVQARLGGRRWLAVTIMTLAMLLVLVVPLVLAVTTIVDYADDIVGWSKSVATRQVPPPPDWVERVPLLGSKIATEWRQLAATPTEELAARATPYIRTAVLWFAGQAGGFALMLLHFLLTVVVTAILYATGETAAKGVRRFARRLAGDRGENSVVLAGQAIRAVALGVVVTAIVQSAAAGLGLAVSGIPYASGAHRRHLHSLHRAARADPCPCAGGGAGSTGRVMRRGARRCWSGPSSWVRWTTCCARFLSGAARTCRCC